MLGILIPNYERFFSEYWDQKLFKSEFNPSLQIDFNSSDFWNLIESNKIPYPQIECLSYQGPTDIAQYLDLNSHPNSRKLRQLSGEGHTIRIRNIDEFVDSLKALKFQLVKTFKSHVSLNMYFSQNSKGTKAHYDVHHVFALQLAGEKSWKFGERVDHTPRYDFTPIRIYNEFTVQKTIPLNAGEMLYVPIGLVHQTETRDSSLHLTIGILPDDWTNYIQGLLHYTMKKHPIMRKSLPFFLVDNKFMYKKPRQEEIEKLLSLLLIEADTFCEDYMMNK